MLQDPLSPIPACCVEQWCRLRCEWLPRTSSVSHSTLHRDKPSADQNQIQNLKPVGLQPLKHSQTQERNEAISGKWLARTPANPRREQLPRASRGRPPSSLLGCRWAFKGSLQNPRIKDYTLNLIRVRLPQMLLANSRCLVGDWHGGIFGAHTCDNYSHETSASGFNRPGTRS